MTLKIKIGLLFIIALAACSDTYNHRKDVSAGSTKHIEIQENVGYAFFSVGSELLNQDIKEYLILQSDDSDKFFVNAKTGNLSFIEPPDYEHPQDKDFNNIYDVEIEATSGGGSKHLLGLTVQVIDQSVPKLEIHFPPAGASLGGDIQEARLSWTVRDLEDGIIADSDLVEFSVNGSVISPKQISDILWAADVPVIHGNNAISLEVRTTSGHRDEKSIKISNQPALIVPVDFMLDEQEANAIVLDAVTGDLTAVDLTSGICRRPHPRIIGADSIALQIPREISLDVLSTPDSARALVVDGVEGQPRIVAIDLASGHKTLVSDKNIQSGGLLNCPNSVAPRVAIKDGKALAVLVDSCGAGFGSVVKVDLSDGVQSTLYLENEAVQNSRSYFTELTLDNFNEPTELILLDRLGLSVFSVNWESGVQKLISGLSKGNGPRLSIPQSVAFSNPESSNSNLLVLDGASLIGTQAGIEEYVDDALFSVDRISGDREIISGRGIGGGDIDFYSPIKIMPMPFKEGQQREALVLDHHALLTVELESGRRSFLSACGMSQQKPSFSLPIAIALDREIASSPQLYVLGQEKNQLHQIDLLQGTILRIDFAQEYFDPSSVELDGNSFLIVDREKKSLSRVPIDGGNIEVLSDSNVGSGDIEFTEPSFVTTGTKPNSMALVIDSPYISPSIISVDLQTGNRRLISNNSEDYSGLPFSSLKALAVDDVTNTPLSRAIATDAAGIVFEVDLTTGSRRILSGPTVGDGVQLMSPAGIALKACNSDIACKGFIVDRDLKALLSVDLYSGDRKVVSSSTVGMGIDFIDPVDIEIDDAANVAFVADRSLGGIVAVNLETGDRVFLRP